MNCVAVIPTHPDLPCKIISGGDEKVLRVFDAPYSFVKTANSLNGDCQMKFSLTESNETIEKRLRGTLETTAQPLKLMNKQIMQA